MLYVCILEPFLNKRWYLERNCSKYPEICLNKILHIFEEVWIRRKYNWIFVTYFLFWYLMDSIYSLNDSQLSKIRREVTFMKYLASVISLIFVPKIWIWNKIMFSASNLLNFAELVEHELMKSISKKNYQSYLFYLIHCCLL